MHQGKMPWGKYRDQFVSEIEDLAYLKWLASDEKFNRLHHFLRSAITLKIKELEKRELKEKMSEIMRGWADSEFTMEESIDKLTKLFKR